MNRKMLPQFVHELFLIWCAQWGKFIINIYTMYVCWVIQKIYAICAAHSYSHITKYIWSNIEN